MKIETIILNFVKSKKKEVEIVGLRGFVRSGENQWSFRYTYRDGNFLSVSKLLKVKLDGIRKIPSFVVKKRSKKIEKIAVKQKQVWQ